MVKIKTGKMKVRDPESNKYVSIDGFAATQDTTTGATIDDSNVSSSTTYSSRKIESALSSLSEEISNIKNSSESGTEINDVSVSTATTYSSSKIEQRLNTLSAQISAINPGVQENSSPTFQAVTADTVTANKIIGAVYG